MIVPGFTAETSLYKTSAFYRGMGSRSPAGAGPAVVAQLDCSTQCYAKYAACLAGCAISGGPFCLPLCFATFIGCQSDCGGNGGGGGGRVNPPHCGCGTNKKCCGKCVKEPGGVVYCDGDCIGLNETCVTGT
jgi:hypothetical protein